jgi:hypothetical protein
MMDAASGAGLMVYDIGRRRLLYDTVLEVIDVERGVVVATTVTDYAAFGFIPGPPLAYTCNEVDGVPDVVVVCITLDRDAR